MSSDRTRSYLVYFALHRRERDDLLASWLFHERLPLLPARASETISLGRVYVDDGSEVLVVDRCREDGRLRFVRQQGEQTTGSHSAFDLLAASLARALRSQLGCFVAGHPDPEAVLRGVQCIRRLGGLVLAPVLPQGTTDPLIERLKSDPVPVARFEPDTFSHLVRHPDQGQS
jgi:hypothetical protein